MLLQRYQQSVASVDSNVPAEDMDLLPLLGEYLTAAESQALLDLELPTTLQAFALRLVVSPFKLINAIVESFFGSAESEQCLVLSTIDKYFHGGSKFHEFLDNYIVRSSFRKDTFFMTSSGYMGLGPHEVREGDTIRSVPGCTYPLVIRPKLNNSNDGKEHFEVVGACYVYGMMNREVVEYPSAREKLRWVVFERVPMYRMIRHPLGKMYY
ncbi:hypothetical protein BKA65DRAFT_563984 [Rhexocercosporidium sp. MPI-PUGE-AT-0058]|nr:hypothetical protein BKA65DRAFT_563984 [Rhexocercosporidium sp. MPI-PUGE-AT-0058]